MEEKKRLIKEVEFLHDENARLSGQLELVRKFLREIIPQLDQAEKALKDIKAVMKPSSGG